MATYQTNNGSHTHKYLCPISVVFDASNETDIIATFLAVKTSLTVAMLPLLMEICSCQGIYREGK
jgi:hypothetical protein